ncbi:hypothetical protein FSP39_020540 [Pinctada imbricata]|uniref:N-acetylated-alpha-linked acidic dipeptidase 2 n=1 Tax=Pinctada imbricata TaxID=66713 RepID=A0AA88YJD7_PINIB|nr:hypothetical protein FSP39_020540 [Pinctada imbricata]
MPPKGKYVAGKQVSRWDAESDNVDIEYKHLENSATPPPRFFSGRKGAALKGLLLLVVFLVGLILGYIIRRNVKEKLMSSSTTKPANHEGIIQDYDEGLCKHIQDDLRDKTNIDDHISHWASSRLSATGTTLRLVGYARAMWADEPVDEIRWSNYTVLLSYAKFWQSDETFILRLRESSNHSVVYQTRYDNMTNNLFEMPFNAYSPSKSVKGQLVYANYGSKTDFQKLKSLNVSVEGKIVVAKYGKIHPANKVKHAEDNSALGMMLYPDPLDFANNSTSVYPSTWWMPEWAVPTHHVRHQLIGDPQTPGYAAIKGVYSLPTTSSSCVGCPKIPVISVSYKDAREYLRDMKGPAVPDSWIGGLGIPYETGPGHSDNSLINITVNNVLEQRCIYNLIAVIRGKVEPDKYVIVGAHYDSWTRGAVDGSSEFAVMSELIRSFSYTRKNTGWRPRRTIIFALWDASKYGHVGSFEWVQENEKLLKYKAVAYINLDTIVRGNYSFCAESSPTLFGMIQSAADTVQCADPDYPEKSVLDMWRMKFPDLNNSSMPRRLSLQGDSDHSPFSYYLGVPSVSPAFTYNTKKYKNLPNYPAYNTLADTKEYLTEFTDRNYTLHVKVTQIIADAILRLADSAFLPHKLRPLHDVMLNGKGELLRLYKTVYSAASLENYTITMYNEKQEYTISKCLSYSEPALDDYNEILLQIPQVFISNTGLPGYPQYRNLLEAPHPENLYETQLFPGVVWTTIKAIETQEWKEVKVQFSLLTLAIREAAIILEQSIEKYDRSEL